jgi:plastocyanin
MKVPYGIMMGVAFFAVAACQHMGLDRGRGSEKDGTPTITRTGEVKDIIIREDNVSPAVVTAHPGDEIRWINRQQGDARVIFLLPMEGQLSCQRGFGGVMSANKNQYTAKLHVNETASVCFKNPSEIKYNQVCGARGFRSFQRRRQYRRHHQHWRPTGIIEHRGPEQENQSRQ